MNCHLKDDIERAVTYGLEIKSQHDYDWNINFSLANAFLLEGTEYVEAIDLYEKTLEKEKDNNIRGMLKNNLGVAYCQDNLP